MAYLAGRGCKSRAARVALAVVLVGAPTLATGCGDGEAPPPATPVPATPTYIAPEPPPPPEPAAPAPEASAPAPITPSANASGPSASGASSLGGAGSGPVARYRFPLPAARAPFIPLAPPAPANAPALVGGVMPATASTAEKIDAHLRAADAAFEANDLNIAGRHYKTARLMGAKRAAPLVGLARVQLAVGNAPLDYGSAKGSRLVRDVVSQLRNAVTLEPDFGPAHVELGRALLVLGDAEHALQSLRKGVERLPDEAEAQSALGVALLASGRGEEAVAPLIRAAEIDPGSAPRHGNLGTVFLMRGRVGDAIAEYELQAQLAPNDAMAHCDLGTALLARGDQRDQGDMARAVKELQEAVRIDPKRATFHSNLGYALQLQGQIKDAVAQYREALRQDDRLSSAWINLATALAKEPSTRREARAALEKARAIDASDPRVRANLDELDALERGASGKSP